MPPISARQPRRDGFTHGLNRPFIMNDTIKSLGRNPDGMAVYEAIVNCASSDARDMDALVSLLTSVDTTGQFLASSARYLCAVDREAFAPWITPLIEGAIDKDRERRYIGSLLEAIWGPDCLARADELRFSDNNFRRIYKRIYPAGHDIRLVTHDNDK